MAEELIVPKLGLTMVSGTITEWVAEAGAQVAEGDILYVLTTDKTTTDVEAEGSGVLHHAVPAGTTLEPGDVAGWLLEPDEAPPTQSPDGTQGATAPAVARVGGSSDAPATPSTNSGKRLVASPYARRRAAELGVDLALVTGTGPGGRIVAADVEEAASRTAATSPPVATSPSTESGGAGRRATPIALRLAERLRLDVATLEGTGPGGRVRLDDVLAAADLRATDPSTEVTDGPEGPGLGDRVPMSPMRKVIAERMTASLQESAQLTLHRDVEVDALVALRNDLKRTWDPTVGPVPSITDLVLKAVAVSLHRNPLLNASLVGDEIVVHDVVDLGLAVAVPDGLVVPVVRSVDELPLSALSAVSAALAAKAREGRLAPDDMELSTFTVSALGAAGIDHFTPILNPPNVGILGVGRVREQVVWRDGAAMPSSVMGLSLTIDHRVVDGAPGAVFLGDLAEVLSQPLRLLV